MALQNLENTKAKLLFAVIAGLCVLRVAEALAGEQSLLLTSLGRSRMEQAQSDPFNTPTHLSLFSNSMSLIFTEEAKL